MKLWSTGLGAFALCAAGILGGVGCSHPDPYGIRTLMHEDGMRLHKLACDLALTPDQKKQTLDVLKAEKAGFVDVCKKMTLAKRTLRDAVLAEMPDEKTIHAAAEAVGKAEGDVSIYASKVLGKLKGVVTAEQRAMIRSALSDIDHNWDHWVDKYLAKKDDAGKM
jgi:Spy/CpxP family protein refolding chaperone